MGEFMHTLRRNHSAVDRKRFDIDRRGYSGNRGFRILKKNERIREDSPDVLVPVCPASEDVFSDQAAFPGERPARRLADAFQTHIRAAPYPVAGFGNAPNGVAQQPVLH